MKRTDTYFRPAMKQVKMQPKGIVCDTSDMTGSGTGFNFDDEEQPTDVASEIQMLLE